MSTSEVVVDENTLHHSCISSKYDNDQIDGDVDGFDVIDADISADNIPDWQK
jgi:hypothetical protein